MEKTAKLLGFLIMLTLVLSDLAGFAGAQEHCSCSCCQKSCDSMMATCRSSCSPLLFCEKNNFAPTLRLLGAFANKHDLLYKHTHILAIFHPPNSRPIALS